MSLEGQEYAADQTAKQEGARSSDDHLVATRPDQVVTTTPRWILDTDREELIYASKLDPGWVVADVYCSGGNDHSKR